MTGSGPATLEWTSCGGLRLDGDHAPATTRRPGSRGPHKSATLIPLASGGCAARASRAFCRWKSLTAHRGEEPSAIRWRRFAAIRPDATRGRGRDPPTRTSRGRPALRPSACVVGDIFKNLFAPSLAFFVELFRGVLECFEDCR